MLSVIFFVAVIGKLVGCGLAALASGMGWVRSLRIGCGMISRGEVGLIVTAMGATSGIFGKSEVAVMVAVVLLTTLLTPIALRSTFNLKSDEDLEDEAGLLEAGLPSSSPELSLTADGAKIEAAQDLSEGASYTIDERSRKAFLAFPAADPISD
jgi:hypothetical protein